MYKLIIIFVLISSFSFGQEGISYASVDSASYADFMKADYKSIRKIGRNAKIAKIDFFYLRMRLGIVAYDKKKYEYAIKHFEKAFEMNPGDIITQEYLYYTYFFSGRLDQAQVLAESLSESFQKKVGLKTKKLESLAIGFQDFSNTNIEDNASRNFLDPSFKRGDAVLNGKTFGFNITLENRLNARTHLYNKLSIFQTYSMGVEQFTSSPGMAATSTTQAIPPTSASLKEVDYKNKQFQYNFGLSRLTKRNLSLSFGLGFYRTNTSDLLVQPSQPQQGIPYNPLGSLVYKEGKTVFNNVSLSLNIGKRLRYISPSIGLSFSNLYNTNQFQAEGGIVYYPFGNTHFYGKTSFAYISNNDIDQNVFTQKIGFKITKYVWLDGIYSVGNHSNYISDIGFSIYNTADPVLSNLNVNLHFYVKKTEFIFGYSLQTRQAQFNQFSSSTVYSIAKYQYTNNNFLTTIKWNF